MKLDISLEASDGVLHHQTMLLAHRCMHTVIMLCDDTCDDSKGIGHGKQLVRGVIPQTYHHALVLEAQL